MRAATLSLGGKQTTITYTRDGQRHTSPLVTIPLGERVKDTAAAKTAEEVKPSDLEKSGILGVSPAAPNTTVGAGEGVVLTGKGIVNIVTLTFESLKEIPAKVPALFNAIFGNTERDPNTPVSVVGASRIGGEFIAVGDWQRVLQLFAVLNLFFGIFNLLPLLPMDGGHIAIAWYERVRSWLAARRGRPDPGRVDYLKLTPITLGVIGVLGVFVLLTVTADVVNPIQIPK
jgi:membrane-associated protease RseP (regulator of RpoE activity)